MCGRMRCTVDPGLVAKVTGVQAEQWKDKERFQPSFNVSPGTYTPVLRGVNKQRDVQCMKWGLVPNFTRKWERPDHFRMFNARSETIDVKASFKRLVGANRCIAMAEGFFEWKKDGAKKQPYYLHLADGRPMMFAALFDMWEDEQGQTLTTYTILTTVASKRMEWLHDRMPAILGDRDAVDAWLGDDPVAAKKVVAPYNADDLVWYAVTPAMGKTSLDGPECVKEIKTTTAAGSAIAKLFGKKQNTDEPVSPSLQVKAEGKGAPSWEEEDPTGGGHMTEVESRAFEAGLYPDRDVVRQDEGCTEFQPWREDEAGPQKLSHQSGGSSCAHPSHRAERGVDEEDAILKPGTSDKDNKGEEGCYHVNCEAKKDEEDIKGESELHEKHEAGPYGGSTAKFELVRNVDDMGCCTDASTGKRKAEDMEERKLEDGSVAGAAKKGGRSMPQEDKNSSKKSCAQWGAAHAQHGTPERGREAGKHFAHVGKRSSSTPGQVKGKAKGGGTGNTRQQTLLTFFQK